LIPIFFSSGFSVMPPKVLLHDEGAQVVVLLAGLWVHDLGEHCEDVREATVGDPHLLAIDDVVLAVVGQHGLRATAVGIAARAGFSEAVGGLPFARGQLGDVLLALCLVAIVQDR
jgi:hypothetical protein